LNKQMLTILTAIIIALLGIGGYFLVKSNKNNIDSTESSKVGSFDLSGQPSLGKADAPVKVVLFEDFKCPACKSFEEVNFKKLNDDYISQGKVELYFVNFAFIGPDSTTAAIATECVWEQNHEDFWKYKKLLFANQGDESKQWATKEFLVDLANQIPELDPTELENCLSSTRYDEDVKNDYKMGVAAGVNSTPSAFVNGKYVNPNSYSQLSNAIEAELK